MFKKQKNHQIIRDSQAHKKNIFQKILKRILIQKRKMKRLKKRKENMYKNQRVQYSNSQNKRIIFD